MCERCHRASSTGFRLDTAGGTPDLVCLRCVLRHGPLLRRSVGVALVVGTVLTAINQGDAIASGDWSAALAWKIPLTYLVPFLVAMWGALTSLRHRPR
jgi:hypothetical protein